MFHAFSTFPFVVLLDYRENAPDSPVLLGVSLLAERAVELYSAVPRAFHIINRDIALMLSSSLAVCGAIHRIYESHFP